MRTRPFTDAHAIAQFEMALFLNGELTREAVDSLLGEAQSVAPEMLPNSCSLPEIPEGQPRTEDVIEHGLRLFGTDPTDNRLTVFLDVYSRFIRFVMLDYRGWSFSKSKGLEVLFSVKNILEKHDAQVSSCGLGCEDRFLLDDAKSYSFSEVFQPFPRYIPPHMANAGPLWHTMNGWFENTEGEARILNNLNVIAGEDEGIHLTRLAHRQQMVSYAEEFSPMAETEIASSFELMYEANKKILRNCLSKEMSKLVGLSED